MWHTSIAAPLSSRAQTPGAASAGFKRTKTCPLRRAETSTAIGTAWVRSQWVPPDKCESGREADMKFPIDVMVPINHSFTLSAPSCKLEWSQDRGHGTAHDSSRLSEPGGQNLQVNGRRSVYRKWAMQDVFLFMRAESALQWPALVCCQHASPAAACHGANVNVTACD